MKALIPIQTPSVANKREHFHARRRRTKAHRMAVAMVLRGPFPALPVEVVLTRVSPRPLDTDNLTMALKAVRDQVAICHYEFVTRARRKARREAG